MTQENKNLYKQIIQNLYVKGSTNIGLAMKSALEIIRDRKHINEVTSIFLLSDGEDTCGNNIERVAQYMEDIDK